MNTIVLRRKLIYVGAIVLLLIPLYFLGHPSVRDSEGEPTNEGGTLAQIRTREDLGQSDLGNLDPASESARLATLGLRGVAATILWQKAEYYKKEKYYDRMAATVNQLKILQPHFVKVWDFQAHNLAYNISVEFDNYKYRYDWVKKGVYYLMEGCKFNKSRTELPFQLGEFTGSKLGIADEKKQFRELFRNDANFHKDVLTLGKLDMTRDTALGPDGKPDNWLAGTLWFQKSYSMVAKGSRPAKSPLMFYCKDPQLHMKHSEAIQSEGYLGEPARSAWKTAGIHLKDYGLRQIRTSWGTIIYLTQLESVAKEYVAKEEEFHNYCGDEYKKLYQKLESGLTDLQRQALKKDTADLAFEEMVALEEAKAVLKIDPFSLARRLPSERQLKALDLAQQLKTLSERRDHVDRYRAQINYTYWESRCVAEQDDAALAARTEMYNANLALDQGKMDEAIELYEKAWVDWNTLFSRFPEMMIDEAAEDVEKSIDSYLAKIEKKRDDLPENFPLKDFLAFRELHAENLADPAVMSLISQWHDKYSERNFLEEVLSKSVAYAAQVRERNATMGDRNPDDPPLPGVKPTFGENTRDTALPRGGVGQAIVDSEEELKSKQPMKAPESKPSTEPQTTPEAKAEEPKAATEPKPEEPKPTTEPKPEEPKPATEPKPEEPKPTTEPKPEEPKPATEPKPEEPKPEEPKPATEPKPEEPQPSTEPKPEEPQPSTEPKPEEPK